MCVLRLFRGVAFAHRHLDDVDVLIAGDAPLKRPQRHQHQIVLVGPEGRLALGLQHTDDLTGEFLQPDVDADRVRPPNNSLRTVAPSMQTALPARSSLSVNSRPPSITQSRTAK